ncbi:hypothetical protein DFH06DRAFT_1392364 [Mycena polygramma]|nr:hypothetical protein DFH06DRAFT_1392364 [Mycena polygramma]
MALISTLEECDHQLDSGRTAPAVLCKKRVTAYGTPVRLRVEQWSQKGTLGRKDCRYLQGGRVSYQEFDLEYKTHKLLTSCVEVPPQQSPCGFPLSYSSVKFQFAGSTSCPQFDPQTPFSESAITASKCAPETTPLGSLTLSPHLCSISFPRFLSPKCFIWESSFGQRSPEIDLFIWSQNTLYRFLHFRSHIPTYMGTRTSAAFFTTLKDPLMDTLRPQKSSHAAQVCRRPFDSGLGPAPKLRFKSLGFRPDCAQEHAQSRGLKWSLGGPFESGSGHRELCRIFY